MNHPHIYVGPWVSFPAGDVSWGDAVDAIREQLSAISPGNGKTYWIPNVSRGQKEILHGEARQMEDQAVPLDGDHLVFSRVSELLESFRPELQTLARIYGVDRPSCGFGVLIYWV